MSREKRCLVTKEQINLVVKSSCIERYPEIKKVLLKHQNKKGGIYKNDIKEEPKEVVEDMINVFSGILEEAESEWMDVGCVRKKRTRCELCNNSQMEYNFKIKNMKNNNIMIVGSRCIEKFKGIDGDKRKRREWINNQHKINRLREINKMYPECKNKIEEYKKFYVDLEVLLPKEIDEEIISILKQMSEFYENYINNKLPKKELFRLKEYTTKFNEITERIQRFIEANKGNLLIVDKELKKWLSISERKVLKDKIMAEGGIITQNTISCIYQDKFIKKFEKIIETQFNYYGFRLKNLEQEGIVFEWEYEGIKLNFKDTLESFMKKFGYLMIGDAVLEERYLKNNIRLDLEASNFSRIISIVNGWLINTNYIIDERRSSVTYTEIDNKQLTTTVFSQSFLSNIQPLLLINNAEERRHNIYEYISKLNRWKDKHTYNIGDIESIMKNRRY